MRILQNFKEADGGLDIYRKKELVCFQPYPGSGWEEACLHRNF